MQPKPLTLKPRNHLCVPKCSFHIVGLHLAIKNEFASGLNDYCKMELTSF